MNSFTYHGKLPSLNEYITRSRANAFEGAKFKEDREGNKRVAVEVVAQEVEFLIPKAQEKRTEPKKPSLKPQIYGDIDDGDIPF